MEKSDLLSLDEIAEKLELIDDEFWSNGECNINLKVQTKETEDIIQLGKQYSIIPTLENLLNLQLYNYFSPNYQIHLNQISLLQIQMLTLYFLKFQQVLQQLEQSHQLL